MTLPAESGPVIVVTIWQQAKERLGPGPSVGHQQATSHTDVTEVLQTQSGTMRLHLVLPVAKAQSARLPIRVVA